MADRMLTDEKCRKSIKSFLNKLWKHDPKKYAANGFGLGAFLDYWPYRWEDDLDWKRTWISVFKRPWTNEDISAKNILPLTSAILLHHQNKYGFDLSVTQKMVQELAEDPTLHDIELQLLQEALLEEDKSGLPVFWSYRFSDWNSNGTC